MSFLRRPRFGEVVQRQLTLFEREQAALIRACEQAERGYDDADRDEAEERYGDYLDLVATGTEELAAMRDAYASTLAAADAARYEREFNRAVARRLPRFGLELAEE